MGTTAELHQVELALVMKGVMDHADKYKDDRFKRFAERASAECLLAFLRANLGPSWPRFCDVLGPGTAPRRGKPSPAGLDNTRHHYVPFYEPGRAVLIEDLRVWLGGDARVRARLIHGDGGMGKTRLFIELCKRLRSEGWEAGFLSEGSYAEASHGTIDVPVASARGDRLCRELAGAPGAARPSGGTARGWRKRGGCEIVLLARGAGDWWAELPCSETLVEDLLSDDEPVELAQLADVGSARATVFRKAAHSLAEVLGRAVPEEVPALHDPRFRRVLYVHMAALAAVDGRSGAVDELMKETLDHEERFWVVEARQERAERIFRRNMRRVVAALTCSGARQRGMKD